jgi:hypothetical protein
VNPYAFWKIIRNFASSYYTGFIQVCETNNETTFGKIMASIKLLVKKHNVSKRDGKIPVYIQYNYCRDQRILINTKRRIEIKHWDFENDVSLIVVSNQFFSEFLKGFIH